MMQYDRLDSIAEDIVTDDDMARQRHHLVGGQTA